MNESYPAKNAYKDRVVVQEYDTRRFTSLKGRYLDKKEKASLMGAVDHLLAKDSGQKTILALDAPCGTGRMTEVIRDMAIPIVGVDISLQIKDAAFSIASCVRLMGHLPRRTKYHILYELLRISRQGAAITFYRSGIRHKVKRLVKTLMGNRAPWYPMSHTQVLKLVQECSTFVCGRFYVHRIISDGVTYALVKERP